MKHSPFAFFRKHQRIGMVILTVMAMFAFVFMDSVNRASSSGGGRASGEVAVKVKGANLTGLELALLKDQQRVVNTFIAEVFLAIHEADENKISQEQLGSQIQMQQFGIEWQTRDADARAVWGHIMRQEAKRLGLVVTDPMIDAYIRRMHENKLTAEQFTQILAALGIRQKQLYDAFREELLARNAWLMTHPATTAADQTPEQYWHYYKQMKVRQNLEVAALPVSEFAKGVKAPADDVLKKFFEEHKNRFANQGLEPWIPGFRQRPKVLVQYLTATYEEIEKTVTPPTDKEITDYYEKNKNTLYREFEKPKLSTDDDPLNPELAPERPAAPAVPEEAADPPKKEPADQSKTPAPETPAEKPADKPAEKPAEKTEAEKTAPEKTETSKPEASKPDTPKTDETKKDPCGVQAETEKTETPKADAPKADTKADAAKPADAKAADAKATEPQPAETKSDAPQPKSDTKAADAKATDAKNAAAKGADAKAGDKAAATGDKTKDPEEPFKTEPEVIKYQPLTDDLKTDISEQLLKVKTTEALNKKSEEALKALDGRNLKYNQPISIKDEKTAYIDFNEDGELNRDESLKVDEPSVVSKTPLDPEHPEKIPPEVAAELKQIVIKMAAADLQKVGKSLGLKFSSTGMATDLEIYEMPGLGKVEEGDGSPFKDTPDMNIIQVLFGKEQLFDASAGRDSEKSDLYVFWKADSSKTHIPTFDEPGIKEEVLEAWRQQQAYPQTLKRAEDLAKQVGKQKLEVALKGQTVNNSKDSLALDVHETADFSWMNPGAPSPNSFVDSPPSLAAPDFVKNPGDEFLTKACEELAVGETGVAPNRDHTIIYVLRVVNREPKAGEEMNRLRESFMKERLFGIIPFRIPSAYTYIAGEEEQKQRFLWRESLKKKYQVEFTDQEKILL